ncbi:CaiB/BaiF CoA transferase family protein [Chloroflexota bacterium]
MAQSILEGLRVLDLAGPQGQFCGKLLADFGAEVIKVEKPGGDDARQTGPFVKDIPHIEGSLSFANFNTNKKSITLDVTSTENRTALELLVSSSDIIIESFLPQDKEKLGFECSDLWKINPGLIVASITGFGQSGPYAAFSSSGIVSFAMGGLMNLCGFPENTPLQAPCELSDQLACLFTVYGILLGLYQREKTGSGEYIEVSVQDAVAAQQHLITNYSCNADIFHRQGSSVPGVGAGAPYGIYRCLDGYVQIAIIVEAHWQTFLDWMGRPEALTDPIFKNRHMRIANAEFIDTFVVAFFAAKKKEEIFEEGQANHLPVTAVQSLGDFINDPQTRARDLFISLEHDYLGQYRVMRNPIRFSASPCRIICPVPQVGQHNQEIFSISAEPITREGIAVKPAKSQRAKPELPLAGVRVLDFSFALAGPLANRFLGEFGAEVIKVESRVRPDRGRIRPGMDPRIILQQKATFIERNRNKKSVTINMTTPEGRDIARRLIQNCDMVVENFSPHVMENWGLDYPQVKALRPDIIMVRMSGFGCTGPRREGVGLAPNAMALTGLFQIWGYPDHDKPIGSPIWFPDWAHGIYGAIAAVAALLYRRRTGKGQVIDLAQTEAMASFLNTAYLDFLCNGREWTFTGNQSADSAPHGCYRCQGEDRWCVIAVHTEEQWQAFCLALGSPSWTKNPKFQSLRGRLENVAELDRHIAEWTKKRTPHQVMWLLQKQGVPAGVVQTSEDLFYDVNLRERGFIIAQRVETGTVDYPGLVTRLYNSPGLVKGGADLGEHNDDVFGKLLGIPEKEIAELVKKRVLY